MPLITTLSASGRRAKPPVWWTNTVSNLPRIELPFLRPKSWTVELAQKWVESIPPRCPFERQLWLRDRLLLYIPPLCPLNPFSTQLYAIRIEAQQFLLEQTKD